MAIQFQAANLPKLQSEFAQPDIAIILTVLSYYNIGLTKVQVIETVKKLLSFVKCFQRRVYIEMFELLKLQTKRSLELEMMYEHLLMLLISLMLRIRYRSTCCMTCTE
jgi:Protein of unknown function (DUF3645)